MDSMSKSKGEKKSDSSLMRHIGFSTNCGLLSTMIVNNTDLSTFGHHAAKKLNINESAQISIQVPIGNHHNDQYI